MIYLKLQILNHETRKDLLRKTSGLKKFASALHMKASSSEIFEDVFYLELPDNLADSCHLINAFEAYGYFHEIACRVASERVIVSLDELIKLLDKEYLADGYKPSKTTQ